VLEIDRWIWSGPAAGPAAEQVALLVAPAKNGTPTPKPTTRPADRPAVVARANEPPFTYRLERFSKPVADWRPSGVAFTADGLMYACDLTEGTVHRAGLPAIGAGPELAWQLFASGLNVPTGMAAIGNRVFVAHRPEVTELVDADGDGLAEQFRTLMGPWSLKDGFHEYAFGLPVDGRGRLAVALNNGYFWSYGGPTTRGRFRSYVLGCDLKGRCHELGWGCRVPNGVSSGPDGEIFFVDNQGDWIQECKLIHCRKGLFYGHPETESQFLPEGQVPEGLPAVWVPYNVIRSAAALCYDTTAGRFGPFAGQFFTGDVGYGQSTNIMRMALEKVDGVYQGAALHFIDHQPAGPQFAAFGPDGQMYVCCLSDGLVRVRWGGQVPMEIHHVSLRRDNRGFVLHFTRPLAAEADAAARAIRVRRWYFPYGIRYGSPRVGEVDVAIRGATVSNDRMSVDLQVPVETYKNCMVYYFHVGRLRAADGGEVEHPEAYYTVQRLWK
jgi:glucose/arabinose dehydrogenase